MLYCQELFNILHLQEISIMLENRINWVIFVSRLDPKESCDLMYNSQVRIGNPWL